MGGVGIRVGIPPRESGSIPNLDNYRHNDNLVSLSVSTFASVTCRALQRPPSSWDNEYFILPYPTVHSHGSMMFFLLHTGPGSNHPPEAPAREQCL